jgi:hypothetical protein
MFSITRKELSKAFGKFIENVHEKSPSQIEKLKEEMEKVDKIIFYASLRAGGLSEFKISNFRLNQFIIIFTNFEAINTFIENLFLIFRNNQIKVFIDFIA